MSTDREYFYTETGQGYHRFDLWFGVPFEKRTGRHVWDRGIHVGIIHDRQQAKKICAALNTSWVVI